MKLKKYEISVKPISGICKSPSMWGYNSERNEICPLIYFRKPKWISQKSFKKIINNIRLDLPKDTILEKGEIK